MNRPRILFAASLTLFVLWVAALGTLAAVSARKPVDKSKSRPSAVAKP